MLLLLSIIYSNAIKIQIKQLLHKKYYIQKIEITPKRLKIEMPKKRQLIWGNLRRRDRCAPKYGPGAKGIVGLADAMFVLGLIWLRDHNHRRA
jgi:hypothetical protein